MCEICGFPSSKRLYSVQSCYLCTNFFREFFINGPDDLVCNGPNPNQCSVLGREETCKACRYQKCLELGMDGSRIRKRKGRSRKCTIIKKRSSRLNLVSSTEEVTVEHVHPKEVTVEHVNPEEVTVEHVYPEEVTVEHVHPEEITVEHVHPVRNHSPPIPKKKELVRSRKPFINPKRRSARIIPVSSMEEITVEHVHPVRNHSPPIPKKKELSTTLARKRKRRSRKPFTIIKKRSSRLNPVSSNKEVTVEKVHSVQNHSPPIPKEKKRVRVRKTFKGPKRRSARLNPVSSTEEVTVERVHPEEITVEQVQPEEVTVEQVHPEEITVEHVHPVQNPLPPTPKEQQLVHALKLHAVKVRLFNRNYEAEQLLEDFVREERLANDRRKFLYSSDSSFANLLASVNAKEIPYSSMNLQPLTFEKTRKHMRSEIIIIYEWIRGWRHFDLLNTQDRVIFLRRCVLYHTILDSCYHSHRMGLPDKFIMFNGMYVGVQPGDKTGWEDETDCITSDLKMKLYRPLMDRLINEVCASMNAIGLSFEEFVILKALVSFKLSSCSNVSSGLKKFLHGHMVTILRALNEHYQESGMSPEEIAHRTGNVILMMSSIFTIGKECRESHQMIQFFELWQLDDLHIKLIQGGGGANES